MGVTALSPGPRGAVPSLLPCLLLKKRSLVLAPTQRMHQTREWIPGGGNQWDHVRKPLTPDSVPHSVWTKSIPDVETVSAKTTIGLRNRQKTGRMRKGGSTA